VCNNPDLCNKYVDKERARWQGQKAAGKVLTITDLNKREQRYKRGKMQLKKFRDKKGAEAERTPPSTPSVHNFEGSRQSRRAIQDNKKQTITRRKIRNRSTYLQTQWRICTVNSKQKTPPRSAMLHFAGLDYFGGLKPNFGGQGQSIQT